MNKDQVIPAVNAKDFDGIKSFRCLPGSPMSYRFSGKDGRFTVGEDVEIGKSISFVPIAYRRFKADNLFGKSGKEWVELFFINKKGAICHITFHGMSAEALVKHYKTLYYDDLELNEVVLTVKGEKKEAEKEGGEKITYYVATFTSVPADVAYLEKIAEIGLPAIWRDDTVRSGQVNISSLNFSAPESLIAGPKEDSDEAEAHE